MPEENSLGNYASGSLTPDHTPIIPSLEVANPPLAGSGSNDQEFIETFKRDNNKLTQEIEQGNEETTRLMDKIFHDKAREALDRGDFVSFKSNARVWAEAQARQTMREKHGTFIDLDDPKNALIMRDMVDGYYDRLRVNMGLRPLALLEDDEFNRVIAERNKVVDPPPTSSNSI